MHGFGGGVALRLQSGASLARFGQGALGGAGALCHFAQPRLADGKRVFRGALLGGFFGGAARQRLALGGDRRRPFGQRGNLGAQARLPLAKNGVLRRGAVSAPLP